MSDPGPSPSALQARYAGRVLGGRYRLGALLGAGGMGAVFRADDARLGREVAVKVILPERLGTDPAPHRGRFRREAVVAARIRHRNVVTVYDFGTETGPDGEPLDYLVMELLEGADLASRRAALLAAPPAERLDVVLQAARGLAEGHRRGVVHRDVSPRNLFLAPEPGGRFHVRVLDFGVAKPVAGGAAFGEITVAPAFVGSPSYASPEQMQGKATPGPESDVFSLAVIAYELLCNRRPYGSAAREAMGRGEAVPAPSLRQRDPRLPPTVDAVLGRALQVDPTRR
ncbi:MAG TPA: serine/threonine-protein kinase, partial [Longimicrobiaceae bacterium]|nr:serine/threonine-protein kinase [Longimicrobiaceae bacterium]